MVHFLGSERRAAALLWSYLKHGPGHLAMYALGRFDTVRSAAVMLNSVRNPPGRVAPMNSESLRLVSVTEAVTALRRDGGYKDLRLEPATLCELREFCERNECSGGDDGGFRFHWSERNAAEQRYGKRFSLGWYLDIASKCPAARRLTEDPVLRSISRSYFQAEPVLIGSRAWWSFAVAKNESEAAQSGQAFHFDIDGYRALSFFFYLTDVDMAGGPHVYVQGSHRRKRLAHVLSLRKSRPDAEIETRYSSQRIDIICGTAGQGFAEDTFGFHKGLVPQSRDRLMMQIRFGLRDYGAGRVH